MFSPQRLEINRSVHQSYKPCTMHLKHSQHTEGGNQSSTCWERLTFNVKNLCAINVTTKMTHCSLKQKESHKRFLHTLFV